MNHHLFNPTPAQIDDAYRQISNQTYVTFTLGAEALTTSLLAMEKSGFVGISIRDFQPTSQNLQVRGYKGKHGPCYDTKRKATLKSYALAALDDDKHLILGDKPLDICEKTARVYQYEPYQSKCEVSAGDTEQIKNLNNHPVPFDCDTFEADSSLLQSLIEKSNAKTDADADDKAKEDLKSVFYPGPFKALILKNGTVIRRGKLNSIYASDLEQLVKQENVVEIDQQARTAPLNYLEETEKEGSGWILSDIEIGKIEQTIHYDIKHWPESVLADLQTTMRQCIDNKKPYFLLTGTDPKDALGCCPSEKVGEANRLVELGLLSKINQTTVQDSCPTHIFAFPGEIKLLEPKPEFEINHPIRQEILSKLNQSNQQGEASNRMTLALRYAIFAFVIISIIVGIKQKMAPTDLKNQTQLTSLLRKNKTIEISLFLFHNAKRCEQCNNMQSFTSEVVEKLNAAKGIGTIDFQLINMDLPSSQSLIDKYDLFTSTLVLIQHDGSTVEKDFIIKEAWETFKDKDAFSAMLEKHIQATLDKE